MQRDVKIGIAIGVLLIALIGIFWWVRSHQSAGEEMMPPDMTSNTLEGPISPVETEGGDMPAIGGTEIAAPGATTTTLPLMAPPAGATGVAGIPPAPPVPAAQTHTVASGETLGGIAKQYYGSEAKWPVIAAANGISDPRSLKIGQKLVIPPADAAVAAPGAVTPPATGARTHKVVAGDTLTSISRKYYGDIAHVEAIYQANKAKMTSKNDLKVGMVLAIP